MFPRAPDCTSAIAHLFDVTIPHWLAEWRQPGLAMCVVDSDGAIRVRGWGARKLGDASAVDCDTIFAIASCTKPFAALSAAFLADSGKLDLQTRVTDILPWFAFTDERANKKASVRDLLCNCLGLMSSEGRHRQVAHDRRDLLRRMRHQPFRHAFRQQYGYCTDAFTIIGEIVETIAGERWDDFMRARLWQPLGMDRTNTDHRRAVADHNHADPHVEVGGAITSIPWIYEDHVALPAGGMNSTALNLGQWLKFMLQDGQWQGRQILSRQMMREICRPHIDEAGEYADHEFSRVLGGGWAGIRNPAYALGFYLHEYHGLQVLYHTGAIDGFRAIVGFVPEAGFGAAVLTNSEHANLPRLVFQSALDLSLGCGGNDFSQKFREDEERWKAAARQGSSAKPTTTRRRTCQGKPIVRPGQYFDRTGFGAAQVTDEGGRLVLKTGMLIFDLMDKGDYFEAYKRWPYPCSRHFVGFPEQDETGEFSGFSTDQYARFEYLAAQTGEGER